MSMMSPLIARPRDDIYMVLKKLGLSSGLHICMDAGQEVSAPASSNKWADLSGGGNGFWRGGNSGAEASADMDFVGTVGQRDKDTYWTNGSATEYFTFEKSITTPLNNAHKNNQKWSLMAWLYVVSSGGAHFILNTYSTTHGISIDVAGNLLRLYIGAGSGSTYFGGGFGSTTIVPGWNFIGLSVEIASGVLSVNINTGSRKQDNVLPTTSGSPSSTAAQGIPRMFAGNVLSGFNTAGDRQNCMCWWADVKRTTAEYEAIFQATRGKFSI